MGALDTSSRIALGLLCLGALAVRLGLYAVSPSVIHPDEVFQYLEPAYRLVRGVGLIAWEYEAGLRSWLWPGVLAGVLWLASLTGDGPLVTGWAVNIFMALTSLVPVICGFCWARAAGGIRAALIAGSLNAFWAGAVLYATHPLADTIGGVLLVGGLYLAAPGSTVASRRLFFAGFVLGFAVAVRVQLGPAVAVAVLGVSGGRVREGHLPLLGGMLLPLLFLGLLDWLTLGLPWQSIWLYARVNQMEGIAAAFGTAPWDAYWPMLRGLLGFSLPVLLLASGFGAYDRPLLFWVVFAGVTTLSVISHKELRFLAPFMPLLLTLAGIGTARALRVLLPWLRPWPAGLLGTLAWLAVSTQVGTSEPMLGIWSQRAAMIRAGRAIAADRDVCGLLIQPTEYWAASMGYSGLRPGIELWLTDPTPRVGATRFNRILANSEADYTSRGFKRIGCWRDRPGGAIRFGFLMDEVCLWRRPGSCTPGPAPTMLTPLPPELQALEPKPAFLQR